MTPIYLFAVQRRDGQRLLRETLDHFLLIQFLSLRVEYLYFVEVVGTRPNFSNYYRGKELGGIRLNSTGLSVNGPELNTSLARQLDIGLDHESFLLIKAGQNLPRRGAVRKLDLFLYRSRVLRRLVWRFGDSLASDSGMCVVNSPATSHQTDKHRGAQGQFRFGQKHSLQNSLC